MANAPMLLRQATIQLNTPLRPQIYWLELAVADIPGQAAPGHFLHVRINNSHDPLLRRPLSICRTVAAGAELRLGLVYRVSGKGTRLLAEKKKDETLDILGPLGRPFDLQPALADPGRPVVLVAGGMGVAPLVFVAQRLRQAAAERRIIACVGMGTAADFVCLEALSDYGCELRLSTDDGSQGHAGYVTEPAAAAVAALRGQKPLLFACGPLAMLRGVHELAQQYGLTAQVSVDEMMGCGLGACLGCVIKCQRRGAAAGESAVVYKRICKDGPVFASDEIVWDEV